MEKFEFTTQGYVDAVKYLKMKDIKYLAIFTLKYAIPYILLVYILAKASYYTISFLANTLLF